MSQEPSDPLITLTESNYKELLGSQIKIVISPQNGKKKEVNKEEGEKEVVNVKTISESEGMEQQKKVNDSNQHNEKAEDKAPDAKENGDAEKDKCYLNECDALYADLVSNINQKYYLIMECPDFEGTQFPKNW